MKAVEVRVRRLAGFTDDIIGTDLMTRALKLGGPLADPEAPSGEVEGTMMLFRGAYAVLRNPSGHREVTFDDVTEASEAVMTASLLLLTPAGGGSVSVHRLVQAVTADQMPAQLGAAWREATAAVIEARPPR